MARSILARNRRAWIAVILLFGWHVAFSQERLFLSDRYIWTGAEGMRAVRITGKFQSAQAMVELLKLDAEVGRLADRRSPNQEKVWTLRAILVSIDFNANGNVATWTVAGPRRLITAYVHTLSEKNDDRSLFYDFGARDLEPYFSTD